VTQKLDRLENREKPFQALVDENLYAYQAAWMSGADRVCPGFFNAHTS
jgi:hypothetical protein